LGRSAQSVGTKRVLKHDPWKREHTRQLEVGTKRGAHATWKRNRSELPKPFAAHRSFEPQPPTWGGGAARMVRGGSQSGASFAWMLRRPGWPQSGSGVHSESKLGLQRGGNLFSNSIVQSVKLYICPQFLCFETHSWLGIVELLICARTQ